MINIIIPEKTPTINHLYFHWNGRTIMNKEGKKLRERIIAMVKEQVKNQGLSMLVNANLSVKVTIRENWYTKKNLIARKDIANREKFLLDSIFLGLKELKPEIDDRQIFEHVMIKEQHPTREEAIIEIEVIE